jgi:hypothetical protein
VTKRVVPIILILAAPALAEEETRASAPPPRPYRDIVFASELAYSREWYDLAYQVLDEMEKARRAPAEAMNQARLLRADILVLEAGGLKDRDKAARQVAEARRIYEDLVRKGGAVGTDASLKIGEIFLKEGEGAASRMRTSEEAEARAAAKAEAEQKFQAAEKYFGDLVEKYAKIETPNDDELYRLMISMFDRGRALYHLAELGEKGTKERDERLKQAEAVFNQVNFDFGDKPQGYDAAIYLGFIRKELGNLKGSIDAFTSAVGLKDFFFDHEDGKYHISDPAMADIIARALYFKAQTLNEVKESQKAIEAAKELFETLPGYQREPIGRAMRIEEAKAWWALGDTKKATKILNDVMAEDPKGNEGGLAKVTLGQLQGGGGASGAMAPERSFAIAKGMIDGGKFVEGTNRLRLLIADLEFAAAAPQPEPDTVKWLPISWFELGRAYLDASRFDEAVAVFEALASRFKESEQAPEALLSKATALASLNGAKANRFDDERYVETLRALSTLYADHPAAKASAFLLGNKKFAEKDYAAAAREYEKVSEAAGKYYDISLYQIGVSYVMEGRRLLQEKKSAEGKLAFASAKRAFEKAIAWCDGGAAAKGELKGERDANLKKLAFRARCRLAEVYLLPILKEPERALEAAVAAEKGLGASADAESLAEARLLIVQAHILGDALDKAEEAQGKLAAAAPESARTARGHRELAIALDGAASKAKEAKKLEEATSLLARAADQYAAWADVSRKAELPVPGSDYVKAGDRLYSMALELNNLKEDVSFADVDDLSKLPAAARFGQAEVAYEAALAAGVPDAWLVRLKASECLGFMGAFDRSAALFEPLIASEKLLKEEKDEKGKKWYRIDADALKGPRGILLFGYADYGNALLRMGAREPQKIDEAIEVLARVIGVAPPNSQIWWRAKHDYFAGLCLKGSYEEAFIGLQAIARVNPRFDGGKYGFEPKFNALMEELKKKQPLGGKSGASRKNN